MIHFSSLWEYLELPHHINLLTQCGLMCGGAGVISYLRADLSVCSCVCVLKELSLAFDILLIWRMFEVWCNISCSHLALSRFPLKSPPFSNYHRQPQCGTKEKCFKCLVNVIKPVTHFFLWESIFTVFFPFLHSQFQNVQLIRPISVLEMCACAALRHSLHLGIVMNDTQLCAWFLCCDVDVSI